MTPFQNTRRTIGTIAFLLAGPILWALHLTFIYGPQSALCAVGQRTSEGGYASAALTTIWLVTLLALVAGALVFVFSDRSYHILAGEHAPAAQWEFFQGVMRLLMGLSLLAVIYAGAAVLFIPVCAQLR